MIIKISELGISRAKAFKIYTKTAREAFLSLSEVGWCACSKEAANRIFSIANSMNQNGEASW